MTSGIVPSFVSLIKAGNGLSKKVYTLAFIENKNEILLGLKKRGFGQGLWNGFGGKVNPGEEIVDAAAREIKEECGLDVIPKNLEQFAVIDFEFVDNPVIMEVHVFRTSVYSGRVTESDEMRPKWYTRDEVPHHEMWADDKVWYPLYLQGQKFKAYFHFKGQTQILNYIIRDYHDEHILLQMSS